MGIHLSELVLAKAHSSDKFQDDGGSPNAITSNLSNSILSNNASKNAEISWHDYNVCKAIYDQKSPDFSQLDQNIASNLNYLKSLNIELDPVRYFFIFKGKTEKYQKEQQRDIIHFYNALQLSKINSDDEPMVYNALKNLIYYDNIYLLYGKLFEINTYILSSRKNLKLEFSTDQDSQSPADFNMIYTMKNLERKIDKYARIINESTNKFKNQLRVIQKMENDTNYAESTIRDLYYIFIHVKPNMQLDDFISQKFYRFPYINIKLVQEHKRILTSFVKLEKNNLIEFNGDRSLDDIISNLNDEYEGINDKLNLLSNINELYFIYMFVYCLRYYSPAELKPITDQLKGFDSISKFFENGINSYISKNPHYFDCVKPLKEIFRKWVYSRISIDDGLAYTPDRFIKMLVDNQKYKTIYEKIYETSPDLNIKISLDSLGKNIIKLDMRNGTYYTVESSILNDIHDYNLLNQSPFDKESKSCIYNKIRINQTTIPEYLNLIIDKKIEHKSGNRNSNIAIICMNMFFDSYKPILSLEQMFALFVENILDIFYVFMEDYLNHVRIINKYLFLFLDEDFIELKKYFKIMDIDYFISHIDNLIQNNILIEKTFDLYKDNIVYIASYVEYFYNNSGWEEDIKKYSDDWETAAKLGYRDATMSIFQNFNNMSKPVSFNYLLGHIAYRLQKNIVVFKSPPNDYNYECSVDQNADLEEYLVYNLSDNFLGSLLAEDIYKMFGEECFFVNKNMDRANYMSKDTIPLKRKWMQAKMDKNSK